MSTILELYPSDGLLWLEFGGIYTDSAGNKVIDNLATRGDAPAKVTCGAGAACPTQLSGKRGVVFAGAQWIDCGLIDRFERTDSFTLVAVTSAITSTSGDIISSIDAAQTLKGVGLITEVPALICCYAISALGTVYMCKFKTLRAHKQVNCYAATHSGTSTVAGLTIYGNGMDLGAAVDFDGLASGTIKNGKPFLLGTRHNGASKTAFLTGTMNFAAIFPLAASAIQVANLTKRVMRRINLP